MRFVFITGTDTDCGKTFVASSIIKELSGKGLLTIGFKPVASGASLAGVRNDVQHIRHEAHEWVNDDALALYNASPLQPPYNVVNPYCFEPAIAPHVAAKEAGNIVTAAKLNAHMAALAQPYPVYPSGQHQCAAVAVVEGAGGWAVPLNDEQSIAQWAVQQSMDVILVVGLKLGCINHAMLSVAAIETSGVKLVGWVANQLSETPMARQQETVDYLTQHIKAPLLKQAAYTPQGHLEWTDNEYEALVKAVGCNPHQAEV